MTRCRSFARVAAALLLILGACTPASEGLPERTGASPAPSSRGTVPTPAGGRRTLRLAGAGDIDSLDPGVMYSSLSWFLARGVFRSLTTYQRGGGAALVGDLATDTGTSNGDATEWTYRLRSGIRFGPAIEGREAQGVTGREIVCDDVKYGIERLFLPGVGAGYPFYYEILEGAKAFEAGSSEEVTGIQCPDDKTVVFRLTQPAADWPYRMAMPAASPVPRSLAAAQDRPGGGDYSRHSVASGPYRVASWEPGKSLRLERNPFWDRVTDEARAASVPAVQWTQGLANDDAVERVIRGEFDLAMDVAPYASLLERVVTDPALEGRLVNEPEGCTQYIFLNTTVPPFDDLLVRRAVNFAIDKANLKRLSGGPVTGPVAASVVPPGVEGHIPPSRYDPFETAADAGSVRRGRKLLAKAGFPDGYAGAVRVVGPKDPPGDKLLASILGDLRRLGFSNLEVVQPGFPDEYDTYYGRPDSDTAIGTSAGWCKDYPRGGSFVDQVLTSDDIEQEDNRNYAELSDPRLDAAVAAAGAEMDPARAEKLWQRVNRIATETAAWVPWSWTESSIIYGPDLDGVVFLGAISHVDWVNASLTR